MDHVSSRHDMGILIARILRNALSYVLMIILAVLTVGPFALMISMSLRPDFNFFYFPIELIPPNPGFGNYVTIFQRSLIGRWILNSTIITSSVVILQLFSSALAGYAFSRGEFPGRDVIFWGLLGTMMIPSTVTIVPRFMLMSWIGWVNTYWAMIVPGATGTFGTFLLRQYVLTIPKEYDEAALIDGAGRVRIWWSVILPLCKPVLATLATLTALGSWNAFLTPLIMMRSEEMKTLPVGLASMVAAGGNAGLQMASATIGFLPTLLMFLIAQRFLVKGISLSGLKG
jgi:multiple sugar transport system permease protein